jgi:hypothetical protein
MQERMKELALKYRSTGIDNHLKAFLKLLSFRDKENTVSIMLVLL